jgi:hypothetical protein
MSSDKGYGGPMGALLAARALPRSAPSPEAMDAAEQELSPAPVARRPFLLRIAWRPRRVMWSWTR